MRSGFEGRVGGAIEEEGWRRDCGRDPASAGLRDGRNGGARRDARLGRRRRAGRAARTYLHRDARGGAWTPGAGVDTGRASLGLTRRAAVRARHRARQILDKIAASRVNDFARSGGNLRFSRVSRLRHDRLPHTRPRVDVVDGPRASARCEAMARYATRHADARTRARALCASPTYRRHDFYRRRRQIDGFASSITGASSFSSSSLDRAPSAPSVFARLGTHRAPRTSPHRRS